MKKWIKNTKETEPDQDGRYLIIYRQGPVVHKFIADYSVVDGWLSMMDAEVLAWSEIPDFPDWLVDDMGEL
jgi:hypothetical protein